MCFSLSFSKPLLIGLVDNSFFYILPYAMKVNSWVQALNLKNGGKNISSG